MTLLKLLTEINAVCTFAEARRMIHQNGVKLNDEIVNNIDYEVPDGHYIVQVGKIKKYKTVIANDQIMCSEKLN